MSLSDAVAARQAKNKATKIVYDIADRRNACSKKYASALMATHAEFPDSTELSQSVFCDILVKYAKAQARGDTSERIRVGLAWMSEADAAKVHAQLVEVDCLRAADLMREQCEVRPGRFLRNTFSVANNTIDVHDIVEIQRLIDEAQCNKTRANETFKNIVYQFVGSRKCGVQAADKLMERLVVEYCNILANDGPRTVNLLELMPETTPEAMELQKMADWIVECFEGQATVCITDGADTHPTDYQSDKVRYNWYEVKFTVL